MISSVFMTPGKIKFPINSYQQFPINEQATLKVFDVLGREVATLVEGELNPCEHSVVFGAKGLASGVYLYRLETTKFGQQNITELIK